MEACKRAPSGRKRRKACSFRRVVESSKGRVAGSTWLGLGVGVGVGVGLGLGLEVGLGLGYGLGLG